MKKLEISWNKQAEQSFLCSAPPILAALKGNLAMMLHLLIGSLLTQTRIMDGVRNTYKARLTAAPQTGRGRHIIVFHRWHFESKNRNSQSKSPGSNQTEV